MGASAVGSIRKRSESGLLFFDFRFRGQRCREQTLLKDTAPNRKKAQKILERIEKEIAAGTFDYSSYFPNSKTAKKFQEREEEAVKLGSSAPNPYVALAPVENPDAMADMPTVEDFADTWFSESEVEWRRSHKKTVKGILAKYIKPKFGEKKVGCITKAEIMVFRSQLAKVPGRKGSTLSNKRINAIMDVLRVVLAEAADRYDFISPYQNIKRLKVPKSDVAPFSLEEVNKIINNVRPDFRNYYIVRFFTGMRTGEIDGLQWEYVDFEKRLILVRVTIVDGEEDYTKTDGSQREIQMTQVVYDALRVQKKVTGDRSRFVFCNGNGEPLDHNNVTKRVWYPLLRHLGLKERRPYQTRHTAATLWLASGENPEWIARQMGHSSTEMLFKVYARYVPNLTRRDGSAFERLLASSLDVSVESEIS